MIAFSRAPLEGRTQSSSAPSTGAAAARPPGLPAHHHPSTMTTGAAAALSACRARPTDPTPRWPAGGGASKQGAINPLTMVQSSSPKVRWVMRVGVRAGRKQSINPLKRCNPLAAYALQSKVSKQRHCKAKHCDARNIVLLGI